MIQKDWWFHAAVTMRLVYCHKKLHLNNCWWTNPQETIAYWNVNHSCYEGWPIAMCGGFSIAMSSPRTSSSQRLVSRQHQYQSSTEPCTTIIITIMLCSVLFIFSLLHFSYFWDFWDFWDFLDFLDFGHFEFFGLFELLGILRIFGLLGLFELFLLETP